MKIETIEDMEKLFKEGKLTHFVVKDETESCFSCSYEYRSMKVKIICFSIPHIGFETISGGTAWIKFLDVNKKETEKLIKEKEMTKKDLKDGMVVKLRNGDKRLVLYDKLLNQIGYDNISSYTDDLKHTNCNDYDVICLYNNYAYSIDNIFKYLSIIWERKEKSEAEIKLENIEKQIEELQKSAKELKEVINNG